MKQQYNWLKAKIDKLFIDARNEDTIGEYIQLTVNSITNSTLSVSEQSSVLIGSIESLADIRAKEIEETQARLTELNQDYAVLVQYKAVAQQLLT